MPRYGTAMNLIESIQTLFRNSQYTLATAIIAALVLVLVVIIFRLRSNAKRRMDQSSALSPGGIDFLALKSIERTGLISQEELSALKMRMADEYLDAKQTGEKKGGSRLPLEVELEQAETEARQLAQIKQKRIARTAQAADPLELDKPSSTPAPPSGVASVQPLPAEQAALLRKHLKIDELQPDEARRFQQMGVITAEEAEKILSYPKIEERSTQPDEIKTDASTENSTVSNDDIQPELLTLEELDQLYESGAISVGQYEAWRWRVKS
ncbi:hypothetical protein JXA32_17235 [Candidatus Sumerlaeota bacterium]|nr:hypothetical protein [Candidatus Sumerlaeota bacterium]